jgi:hypothetical protein
LVVWYLHPAEASRNDLYNVNTFDLVAMMIFVKGSQWATQQYGCRLSIFGFEFLFIQGVGTVGGMNSHGP